MELVSLAGIGLIVYAVLLFAHLFKLEGYIHDIQDALVRLEYNVARHDDDHTAFSDKQDRELQVLYKICNALDRANSYR